MPVIDETVVSKEIKAFKEEVRNILKEFEARLSSLESKKAK